MRQHYPYFSWPWIDPVALTIGSVEIRWYGLAYVLAAIVAGFIARSELERRGGPVPVEMWPEMLFYGMLSVLIGGRLGEVLIYDFSHYRTAPLEVFATWRGGMSFHGGLVGLLTAGIIWARLRRVSFLELADIGALAAPMGIMFVKIANFINGELYGRETTVWWGVVFPHAGGLPRHPSQVYEALVEGPLLFLILWRFRLMAHKSGSVLALFLVLYGAGRFAVEFYREPDLPFGLILGWVSMGQLLCLCMVCAGLGLLICNRHARK